MIDFTSRVLTQFKADPSELKAALKDLQGEEKKLAQAQLDATNARNKGYDDWIGKLANVNQALELGGKALSFARDSFKAYADDLRLRSAAGAVSIDKLKEASLGLRTEHELLSFAAQTQNAAFKLNEQQMVTAQKAMVALTRAGFDQEEVTKKVTEALVKANGGGLDDFGILVRESSTDVGKFNNLMEALAQKASGVDTGMRSAGESMQASSVSINDSFDKMKQALGSLVAAMSPLLEALAAAVGLVAEIAKGTTSEVNWIDAVNQWGKQQGASGDLVTRDMSLAQAMAQMQRQQAGPQMVASRDRWGDGGAAGIDDGNLQRALTGFNAFANKYDKRFNGKPGKADPAIAEAAKERADLILAEYEEANKIALERMESGVDAKTDVSNLLRANMANGMLGIPDDASLQEALDSAMAIGEDARRRLYDQFNAQQSESFLEQTFGSIEEINYYQQAFSAFGEAVGSAYEAIVTGAGGAGAAFKQMLADSLMSIGKESAVRTIQETAYGFGSLAFGNFPGAAAHFKAAALHGTVAVAAGVAASQIGTSAQTAASEKASAEKAKEEEKKAKEEEKAQKQASKGGRSSGGGSGSDAERPVYFLVGDHWDDKTPRERRQHAQELAERAMRESDR